MDFENVVTKSPNLVLTRLRSEAQATVINELAGVLVADQAQALAQQCQDAIPVAEKAQADVEKALKLAERVVGKRRSELEKALAEEKKTRRAKGVGEGALLAVGQARRQKARQLVDAESLVRTLTHDLRHARQKVRNLARLVDGLGSYELPEGHTLSLLARALRNGKNG